MIIAPEKTAQIPGLYSRFDLQFTISPGDDSVKLVIGQRSNEICVEIARETGFLHITSQNDGSASYIFSSLNIGTNFQDKHISIRVVAESDIIEVFLADQYSLCARINRQLLDEHISFISNSQIVLQDIDIFRLRWLEEIS